MLRKNIEEGKAPLDSYYGSEHLYTDKLKSMKKLGVVYSIERIL